MMCFGMCKIFFRVEVFVSCGILIGIEIPYLWANDVKSHSGLKIRLIELGKDSVGKVRFELGVKILFCVNINKAAASTSIIIVFVSILNSDMILSYFQFRSIQKNETLFLIDSCLFSIHY